MNLKVIGWTMNKKNRLRVGNFNAILLEDIATQGDEFFVNQVGS